MNPSDIVAEFTPSHGQLSYSYESCGNLNDYSEDRHSAYLRGKHLRVSIPADSGSGYTVVTLDESGKVCKGQKPRPASCDSPDAVRTGSVIEFMREISTGARERADTPTTS
jgi:hypothetical protein